MTRVRLIHWKAKEALEKIAKLKAAGYEIEYEELNADSFKTLRNNPPDVFVIDLSRMPSHGRDVA